MIYVAHLPHEPQDKLGLPTFLHRTFTEEFNEQKPMEGIYSSKWPNYSQLRDGAPVPESLRLPAKLILVCKGIRRFMPDFFTDTPLEWIVSAAFLKFLKSNHLLLEGYYEQSELTLLSATKKPITTKQYYLLRLIKNYNALIEFEKSPKVFSSQKPLTEQTPARFYYSDLVFQRHAQVPPLFFPNDRSYWYSFFCNEEIKTEIEKENFLGIRFHTLEDYAQEQLYYEQYPLGPPSDEPKPLP